MAARALAALSRLAGGDQQRSSWVRSNIPLLERLTLAAAAHLRTADAADLTELVSAFASLGFYPGKKFLRWHDSSCTHLRRAFPDAKLCKVNVKREHSC